MYLVEQEVVELEVKVTMNHIKSSPTTAAVEPQPFTCRWVPGSMSRVRIRGTDNEADISVARLERFVGREQIGQLYLAGRLNFAMDAKTWDAVRRDPPGPSFTTRS